MERRGKRKVAVPPSKRGKQKQSQRAVVKLPPVSCLPSPAALGLPERFAAWRPGQGEAVLHLAESERPFSVLALPTGVGKSPAYTAFAELSASRRALFLTSTRGLQDQLGREFGEMGWVDVRGANNYLCELLRQRQWPSATQQQFPAHLGCDLGPCHVGEKCELKKSGCHYYDAVRRASIASRVCANYSFWLHSRAYAAGIGNFDLQVCDEAHELLEEMARFLRVELRQRELREWSLVLPAAASDAEQCAAWAQESQELLPDPEHMERGEQAKRLRRLVVKLSRLAAMPPDAVVEWREWKGESQLVVEPLWPGKEARSMLFLPAVRGVKMVLSSATITEKHLSLLGIGEEEYDWYECKSPFSVVRRPVIWLNTGIDCRLRAGHVPEEWFRRIDKIVEKRLDRKGIIHAVSYSRAREIVERSRYGQHMLLHTTENARDRVEAFKRSDPPRILVSPSVSTGYDFPGRDAEWQIIAKIPFPDTRVPVTKARCEADKDYPLHLAMTQLVQAVGRIVRGESDRGETFVIDDQWRWFRNAARHHAPASFWAATGEQMYVPDPPPRVAA